MSERITSKIVEAKIVWLVNKFGLDVKVEGVGSDYYVIYLDGRRIADSCRGNREVYNSLCVIENTLDTIRR